MKSIRLKQYCIIFLFLLVSCNRKIENSKLASITKIQAKLIKSMAISLPNQTQFAIGIIEKGEVKYYGIKVENDTIRKVNNAKSIFEIGSITKVFTSALLASFVLDKKIHLNDYIGEYIDIPLNTNQKITFVQLANHTSGLPRLPSNLNVNTTQNPYKDYREVNLTYYLSNELELFTDPGEKYLYSNIGVGLLGYLLCKIDDTEFENLIQQNLFTKYNMTSSTSDKNKIKNHLVAGLNEAGKEVPNWDIGSLVAAGGVFSSVEDLANFVVAHFDSTNLELTLTRQKTFSINHISDMGLGWEIINRKSGATWYKHNGGTGGYSSSIIIDAEHRNGVAILSNVSAYSSKRPIINELIYQLMKTLK